MAKKKADPQVEAEAPKKKRIRQHRQNVRVSPEFMAMGEAIAKHYGVESVTGAIRFLFLREYREIAPGAQVPKGKGGKES